jgi:CBS-domain-containing membrane protein
MNITVQDVMTHDVVVAGEQAGFRDVVLLLRKHNVSALPVVDGSARVVGSSPRATCTSSSHWRRLPPACTDGWVTRRTQVLALVAQARATDGVITVHSHLRYDVNDTSDWATRSRSLREIARQPTVQDVTSRDVVVAREPAPFHQLVMLLSRERWRREVRRFADGGAGGEPPSAARSPGPLGRGSRGRCRRAWRPATVLCEQGRWTLPPSEAEVQPGW